MPHKANFLPNAMVNAKVNGHLMRDASQGSPRSGGAGPYPWGSKGVRQLSPDALCGRRSNSFATTLVTVCILAHRPELAVGKNGKSHARRR